MPWDAIFLTLKLAAVTTVILIVLGLPLAWWLATTRSRVRPVIEAITTLPLVLPPTVLGFYLLILFSPDAPLGDFWLSLTGNTLTFSFTGLVIASCLYSLPFAVQPMQAAFSVLGRGAMEAARTLGAGRWDAFRTIALPLARRGVLTASVLSFAHTLGEFGVVLMVGGNIPGQTRVIAIEIFTAVETLDYKTAHILSAALLGFSFLVLLFVYVVNGRGVRTYG
ncbi:molybdate ABC transporter permease subunit [Ovoidimarina sediminis]|uniref:molybdate ABC transporter permease subunit n=1 Tax=Ovoidimarina sediminis TaxID=3079856 RepID=UPI00290AD3E1|nr:molybdate ABC transporter permease subunit [Rhodophyticola sp. MJ-SS7]MDU8941991.1 molybdate ABC transporter permease subunit [Rhodophyticola sp. MJ-SS7]